MILLAALAGAALGNIALAPPDPNADLDVEPKDAERASFVVEGEVVARYTRNIKNRRVEDSALAPQAESPQDRNAVDQLLKTNWIYGVYEVRVDDWAQVTAAVSHPGSPRMDRGVVAVYRGLSDAPLPDGPYAAFSADVPMKDFEQVEKGERYRFFVEEDRFFGRHWYKLSAVEPIAQESP